MAKTNPFTGKVAVITGGASGFGAALAKTLKEQGARPALIDIDEAALESTSRDLDCMAVKCDVRNAGPLAEAVQLIRSKLGPIDLVVANAATDLTGEAHHYSAQDWDTVIDTNLKGIANLLTATYPEMVARKRGQILIISSGAGRIGFPMGLPYTATKSALGGLAAALRAEAQHHTVKINLVTLPLLKDGLTQRALSQDGINRRAFLAALPGKVFALEDASYATLQGAARDKPRIIFPYIQGFSYWLMDVVPLLGSAVRRNIVAKFHKVARK